MKLIIIIICLLLQVSNSIIAQEPEWQWAKSGGGYDRDEIFDICTDSHSNVYLLGDGFYFTMDTLSLNYKNFLIKCSPSGEILWSKDIQKSGVAMAIDSNNNLYITGNDHFDSVTVAMDTIDISYIFISKYDENGNLIWSKNAGTFSSSGGYSRKISYRNGNIYIMGDFGIGYITFVDTILSSINQVRDIFLIKYDTLCHPIWAKTFGGENIEYCYDMTTDNDNNVFVTGTFTSQIISFDSISIENLVYESLYLVKYDCNGNVCWAKTAGGTSYDEGKSIVTDIHGNIYLTGSFASPFIVFDDDTIQNSNPSYFQYFLTKYDSQGNVIWVKSASGSSYGSALMSDYDSNIYVIGYYLAQIVFDSLHVLDSTTSGGYILKYLPSGDIKWLSSINGASPSFIALGVDNDIYIAGEFENGSILIGNDTLMNISGICDLVSMQLCPDVFIAKLHDYTWSIDENENDDIETLFPNPTTGKVTISNLPESCIIQVFNSTGQIVQTENVKHHKSKDFTFHETGIYFIRILSNNEVVTKKVVVFR